jgi:hypothetical protein
MNIDNKTRFCYRDGYGCRLFDASISWPSAETDTQPTFPRIPIAVVTITSTPGVDENTNFLYKHGY